ncbi:sodium channel protein Nach-like [Maniola hyperantus]|uniref:sodium channel protein Nach-like n=1 Tax=Aphantopus hyperantus TaxID=2795564 RepID=UPI00374873AE
MRFLRSKYHGTENKRTTSIKKLKNKKAAPTVISVERNYFDWNISYPAITLCPLYKPDAIKLGKLINDTSKKTELNVKGYVWAIAQAALDTLDFLDLDPPNELQLLIDPKDYAKAAASLFRNFEENWLASKVNVAISVNAAMTEMGMCHVINSNVAIFDNPHNWNSAAIAAETYVKKNIELSIFEADFFTLITNYESVYKVFIHGPDEVTMTTGSSFIFDVEGFISFGLSVWSTRISEELRNKSLRLRKCRFTHEPISKRYPVYSFNHCILECRIKMILRICGCIPHFYKPLNNERVCYISELKCVLKHRREIITLKTSEETYKKFCNAKNLPKISRDCGCLNSCELDLYYKDNEDFLPGKGLNKLKIKITSFPKVRVVRDVIFSFYDIVLRSGGVMNLCIGSSLISLVEFILEVVKCILYFPLKAFKSIY